MSDIDELIEKGLHRRKVTRKELESVLGKGNEASFIVQELRFFFSHLRYRLKIAIKYGRAFLQPGATPHMAEVANIWMVIKLKLLNIKVDGNGMKFLDQSDNMMAIAWMLRSTYYKKENRPEAILREIMARSLSKTSFSI